MPRPGGYTMVWPYLNTQRDLVRAVIDEHEVMANTGMDPRNCDWLLSDSLRDYVVARVRGRWAHDNGFKNDLFPFSADAVIRLWHQANESMDLLRAWAEPAAKAG